ncbi:MAG: YihY/virulence factor BrkB family protein [Polyangiaceae bacterium]
MLDGIGRARTLGLAAEMSFWLFFALVPLAAVAGFVAARMATAHVVALSSVLGAVPTEVRELITRQVLSVASLRGGTLAPAAALTFLWLASSGFSAIFEGIEVQTGTSRPWWKRRLLAIAACVAFALGGAVLALLGAGLERLGAVAGGGLPPWVVGFATGPVARIVRVAVGAVVAVAMLAGLYRLAVPRDDRSNQPLLPGSVAAAAMQASLGWAYGVYVTRLGGSGSAYLAGLAVVGVTLTTLWLFCIALLLGAQLNRAIGDSRGDRSPRRSRPAGPAPEKRDDLFGRPAHVAELDEPPRQPIVTPQH